MDAVQAIQQSQAYFIRLMQESGIGRIIGGQIAFLECNDQYAQLDVTAGLDNIEITSLGVRGIAYRNLTMSQYDTITIRYSLPSGNPTEYQKRLYAIDNKDDGWIYPYWTVNSYTDRDDQFVKFFVIKTEVLINYARNNLDKISKPQLPGGVEFLAIPFEDLKGSCFGIVKKDGAWFYKEGSLQL